MSGPLVLIDYNSILKLTKWLTKDKTFYPTYLKSWASSRYYLSKQCITDPLLFFDRFKNSNRLILLSRKSHCSFMVLQHNQHNEAIFWDLRSPAVWDCSHVSYESVSCPGWWEGEPPGAEWHGTPGAVETDQTHRSQGQSEFITGISYILSESEQRRAKFTFSSDYEAFGFRARLGLGLGLVIIFYQSGGWGSQKDILSSFLRW